MADGARQTIVRSYRLDLESEIELRIQVKELRFNNGYLLKVIDDKKSSFTQMEVLDLIYHRNFFTTNSFGRKLTTSLFFHPLALQMLVLVAAAIHCALSEYATGKKVTVMLSQDEYRGKISLSTVIDCITAEATALINYTWWAAVYPPAPPPPPMVLLRYNWRSSIPNTTPQCRLALRYFIQLSILPCQLVLLLQNGCSSIPSLTSIRSTSISFQTLSLPLLLATLSMDSLLNWIGAPWPGFLPLNFILHSSITIITPLAHPALLIRHSSFPDGEPLFPAYSSYCHSISITIQCELIS